MPKKSPWIKQPPPEDVLMRKGRINSNECVLLQVWVPRTLRGQLHELARELSEEHDRHVTMSDVIRLGCRIVIRDKLKGG